MGIQGRSQFARKYGQRIRSAAGACTVAAGIYFYLEPHIASATIYRWTGGTSNWSGTGNWSPTGLPATNDNAILTSSSNNPAGAITYDYTGAPVTLSSFQVDGTPAETFLMPTGNLSVAGNELVANMLSATFNQTGGTNAIISGTSGHKLVLGSTYPSAGVYLLSGNAVLSAPGESIGNSGSGIFNQSGGSNTLTGANTGGISIVLGGGLGASGTYYLSSGTLTVAQEEIVGWTGGLGTFVQTGGTHTLTSSLYALFIGVAGYGGASGYSLSGSGILSTASSEIIGDTSSGYFNQTGGTNTVRGSTGLELGASAQSVGSYLLTAGTFTATGSAYIGGGLSGTNASAGGVGLLTVSGTGVFNAGSLTVFNTSGTSLNLSGGTINLGQFNLSGAPSLLHWTSGTLNVSGGSVNLNGTLTIPTNGSFTGGMNVSGPVEVSGGGSINPSLVTLTSLTMDANSSLYENVLGTAAGGANGFGEIISTGKIELSNPTLLLNLAYVPVAGDIFTLISNRGTDSVSGTFADLPQDAFFTGQDSSGRTDLFEISYTGGVNGKSVTLTTVAVPEPAFISLPVIGVSLLGSRRRRSKSPIGYV